MEYKCNICNKIYSSYQSIWIHNKKFHKVCDNTTIIPDNTSIIPDKKYNCRTCLKKFNKFQNRWKHEKICKNKNIIVDDKNTNNGTINNNTNNGIINNTNNIIITQIGRESVDKISINDILSIVKENYNMPITCIEKINFNKKYPENHSFCTTTLEGKHFTRINHKTQKPEKINKLDFINEVLDSSLRFINNLSLMVEFDESFRDKIPLEYQQKIIDILNNQNKFHQAKTKKAFFNCINDMSYNFKDIILETWKLIQPLNEIDSDSDDSFIIGKNYKYTSSDDESD